MAEEEKKGEGERKEEFPDPPPTPPLSPSSPFQFCRETFRSTCSREQEIHPILKTCFSCFYGEVCILLHNPIKSLQKSLKIAFKFGKYMALPRPPLFWWALKNREIKRGSLHPPSASAQSSPPPSPELNPFFTVAQISSYPTTLRCVQFPSPKSEDRNIINRGQRGDRRVCCAHTTILLRTGWSAWTAATVRRSSCFP